MTLLVNDLLQYVQTMRDVWTSFDATQNTHESLTYKKTYSSNLKKESNHNYAKLNILWITRSLLSILSINKITYIKSPQHRKDTLMEIEVCEWAISCSELS